MSKVANDNIKDIFQISFEDEVKKISGLDLSKIEYKELSIDEAKKLAEKIALLPLEYRNILFFRYCFDSRPAETENILEIENAIGKLRYIQKMLSDFMELENFWIDNDSMKMASEIAMSREVEEYDNAEMLHKPNYSKDFRHKLKAIKIKQSLNNRFISIAKKVATFILVCLLTFSAVLAVNAEAREKVFGWVVETFPEYSIFTPENTEELEGDVDLSSIKINYIPERFKLMETNEGHGILIYNYLAENDKKLTITFIASFVKSKSYYDTENAKIEEVNLKGSKAYTWNKLDSTYLIWNQENIEIHIFGKISKEELFKIAENISK